MRVLITGATGFVGRTLCGILGGAGQVVRAAMRRDGVLPEGAAERVIVGDIDGTTDWEAHLQAVDAVIHLAARTHMVRDTEANAGQYIAINRDGTRRLAEAAASAGTRRFVYLSSIKVNGEGLASGAYTSADEPRPVDVYGRSKWLGEQAAIEVGERTGMQIAIVRSPLVYGAGVRGNFLRLMQWVDKQWPLPFGAINNRRSLVNVWNLCDLLARLLGNRVAMSSIWMVSDGEDLSTPELVRRLARSMHRRVRLVPIPAQLLQLCATATRREAEFARLCGSLTVDMGSTHGGLDWSPPISVEEGLARTAAWYLSEDGARGG